MIAAILLAASAFVTETTLEMKTYPFSDPDPVPAVETTRYPYFFFDGTTSASEMRAWKAVVLENERIRVTLVPEIGGKIWGVRDKRTGKDVVYHNHVVKFRNISQRGPWCSGGIEFNFGIIGHGPWTATPVSYFVRTNDDASVSCFVSETELVTLATWQVEVNLKPDAEGFTTRTIWFNGSGLQMPYYQWMNAAFPLDRDPTFEFPGRAYVGHEGDSHPWPVEDGHNLLRYSGNAFGGPKSEHVVNGDNGFYGIWWPAKDGQEAVGFVHSNHVTQKYGRKVWLWALSRDGAIWEDLLTDSDGQYTELQSGRAFNQPRGDTYLTPFKHLTFAPGATEVFEEDWSVVRDRAVFERAWKPENFADRPQKMPKDFDWDTVYGHYVVGQQMLRQRMDREAEPELLKSIAKDPYFVPALGQLAMLAVRRAEYAKAHDWATRALSVDTYDAAANYYDGLAFAAEGLLRRAKERLGLAAYSPEFRSAALATVARLELREGDFAAAETLADQALLANGLNLDAILVKLVVRRLSGDRDGAKRLATDVLACVPLFHAARYELSLAAGGDGPFDRYLRNELPQETYLSLGTWYEAAGRAEDAALFFGKAGARTAVGLIRAAFVAHGQGDDARAKDLLEKAATMSVDFALTFRRETLPALRWARAANPSWKFAYLEAVLLAAFARDAEANALLEGCGEKPDSATFYLFRASRRTGNAALADLRRAAKFGDSWRVGNALYLHFSKAGDWKTACAEVERYIKRLPSNILNIDYANALARSGRPAEAIAFMERTEFLPSEHGDNASGAWLDACRLVAAEALKKGDRKAAEDVVRKAAAYPENLGVGRPYDLDFKPGKGGRRNPLADWSGELREMLLRAFSPSLGKATVFEPPKGCTNETKLLRQFYEDNHRMRFEYVVVPERLKTAANVDFGTARSAITLSYEEVPGFAALERFLDFSSDATRTKAGELAHAITAARPFLPLKCLPSAYYGDETYPFVKELPTVYDETRQVADCVTARRNGRDWYLAIENHGMETMKFTVPLGFLGEGSRRMLAFGKDGRVERLVSAAETLELEVGPHDGFAARFAPPVTLHIAGDSTLAPRRDYKPNGSWGEALRPYLAANVRLSNCAVGGRSTKSFRGLGHWGHDIAPYLRKGDWVLIQFATNDAVTNQPYRSCTPEEYAENLRKYVAEIRKAGAETLLVSCLSHRLYSADGKFAERFRLQPYTDAMAGVAKELDVPYVDLTAPTMAAVRDAGAEGSKGLFLCSVNGKDNIHPTKAGAAAFARVFLEELARRPDHPARALFRTLAFNVTDYGAVGDGKVLCTEAFAKAVAACAEAGGGRVSVPAGTYFTGPIHLRSNVELHLEKGAEILFTDDRSAYLPPVMSSWEGLECLNLSPLLYAYCCTNVAVTGEGVIRAMMDYWYEQMKEGKTGIQEARAILYKWGSEDYPVEKRDMVAAHPAVLRPQLVQFNRCKGIRMEGVHVKDSPFWTIHLFMCDGVVIRGIDVCAHGFNNDGVDIEMTRNVLIEDSTFDQGDDGFVFKAGRNRDAWRTATPTENVEIRNCHVKQAGSLVGVGSELSGGIRNIYVHDCTVDNASRLYFIKTNHRRGGFVKNVRLENVRTRIVKQVAALSTLTLYQWAAFPDYETRITEIDGLSIRNVTCEACEECAFALRGDKRLPAKNVVLENVSVGRTQGQLFNIENVENVKIANVTSGGIGEVRYEFDGGRPKEVTAFGDGERVVFLGDSITHHSHWINALTDFYLTRFPDRKITFRNAGLSGGTAGAALRRLDEDVVPWNPTTVTILFGMNAEGEGHDNAIRLFRESSSKLGESLKRLCPNARRIWLGATPYDEAFSGKKPGKASVVAACARETSAVAKSLGDPFVDLNAPLAAINRRHQRTDPKFTLCGGDGVHPREAGALAIVNELCRAQGLLCEGPSVVLDAASGVRTFAVREKSLPFPVEPAAKAIADELGFVSACASEIAQVKGLPEGRWTLTVDGEKVAEASSAEFAAGIELGKIETPMMKQARKVAAANRAIRDLERSRQYCSAVRQTILKPKLGAAADDFAAVRRFIEEKRNDPEVKALYFAKYFDLYLRDWPRREELAAEILRRETELDRIRQPVSRTWRIMEKCK